MEDKNIEQERKEEVVGDWAVGSNFTAAAAAARAMGLNIWFGLEGVCRRCWDGEKLYWESGEGGDVLRCRCGEVLGTEREMMLRRLRVLWAGWKGSRFMRSVIEATAEEVRRGEVRGYMDLVRALSRDDLFPGAGKPVVHVRPAETRKKKEGEVRMEDMVLWEYEDKL